jgi:hypothetical protein
VYVDGNERACFPRLRRSNREEPIHVRTMEELSNYVGLHFTKHHPADIKKMMKLMQDTKILESTDHEVGASMTAVRIWEQEVTMYVKQVGNYKTNKCALYTLSFGASQCSEAMQAKIKSDKLYDSMQEEYDNLQLIKGIAWLQV